MTVMVANSFARLQSSPLFKNVVAASSGKLLFLMVSFARNLFLARLLGPSDFGVWTLGLVWLQYAQWSHFSLLNAFRLEGARCRGAGEAEALLRLRRLTWTACILPAALVVLAAVGAAYMESGPARNVALMLSVLLLPYQLYTFANSSLSVEEKFVVLAQLQVVYAILNMVLTLGLTFLWGFWGALVAQVISYMAVLIAYRRQFPLYLTPLFDWNLICTQFKTGLPIGLSGLVYSLFVTLDRTIVASALGVAALGQYGLTALARSSIGLVPDAIGEVIYMRTSARYGETGAVSAVLPMILRVDQVIAYLIAPVIGIVVIWTPWVIRVLLPEYQPGTLALQIFLVGFFFIFPVYAGVLLTSIGKAAELLVIYVIVTGAQAIFVWLGVRVLDIAGAALGTIGGSLLLFLAINIWGLGRVRVCPKRVAIHILECLLPLAGMILGLGTVWFVAQWGVAESWVPIHELIGSGLFLLINLPFIIWGARRFLSVLVALKSV